MTAEARSVVVRLSMEASQYIREAQRAGKLGADAIGQVETSADRSSRALDGLGSKAGKVGLAAATGLGLAAKAAMDWETAWAGVTKTVDGTSAELNQLEGDLRELARTMPATHAEIAAVAEAAGQLGVAREDIVDFTTTMIQLGESTNLSADQAATSIAQLQNVMRTAPEDVDNLGAALVALGNDGASTEDQIIQMAQRISGAAAQIGLAESEVLAIANTVASAGIEVEAGGSSVSRVLGTLARSVASGGAELDTFAETAGVSSEKFVKSFKDDPAEAFASFISGLGRISEEGGNVFAVLDELGLKDIRVSDALLRMAANSDLLTDSLELGAEAWAENSALVDEYGKRVDTSAAQAQIAWNNIKDAGIEAGEALLPIISEVADVVTVLAQAFGSLPDPAQNAVTKMLAITAVFGGGLWFTSKVIGGITSARTELSSLATQAPRTATALGRIAKVGGGLLLVGTAMGAIADGINRINASDLDRTFEALSRGTETEDVEQVISDLENLVSNWNAVDLGEVVTVGGLFGDTSLDRAADNVEQFDQKLASLVETGQAAQAELVFDKLIEESGLSASEASDMFDSYTLALENAAASGETLAGSAETAATAADKHTAAIEAETAALEADIAAMEELRAARLEAINAELAYSSALLDTRDYLEDHGRVLEGLKRVEDAHTRTQIEAVGVLNNQAASWNDLSAAAQQAPGAFESARASLIRSARQLGLNKKAAEDYADAVLEIPPKAVTDAEFNVEQAKKTLAQYKRELDNLDGRTIRQFAKFAILGPSGAGPSTQGEGPLFGEADGGTIPGQRQPYGDKVLVLAAPGEEFITNRHGEADRYRADRAAGRIPRYADGGTVGRFANGGTVAGGGDGMTRLEREAHRAANALAKEVEERRKHLDALISARQTLVQSVRDQFRTNPFEPSGNIWAQGAGDFKASLRGDIADARAFSAATAKLRKKGLGGQALSYLAQNADLATVQGMAGLSRADLADYERLYGVRQRVTARVGRETGDAVYGRQIASIREELQSMNHKLKHLRHVGKDVGEEINRAAGTAARRGRDD